VIVRRYPSGAVLPESALVISTILLLMLGSLRLGIIAYTQMSADAAAFTYARFAGVGDPNVSSKTSTAVSNIKPNDITTAQGLPAAAQAPVDYNLTQDQNRHGGATMIQAAQVVTTVLKTNLDGVLLGSNPLSVTSTAIAPQYLDFYSHEDVLGQAVNSSAALGNAQNYFSGGENVPPYFVGFHFMEYCEASLESGPWTQCPGTIDFDAIGMAEYLDQDNWNRSQPGVSGSDAVFKEMLCHQNEFANDAALAYAATTHTAAASVLTPNQSDIQMIYSWDVHAQGGYPPASYTGPGSFPTAPDAGCPT
jgi:hypothetical protein